MSVIWQTIVDYSVLTIFHLETMVDEYHVRSAVRREERKNAGFPNG